MLMNILPRQRVLAIAISLVAFHGSVLAQTPGQASASTQGDGWKVVWQDDFEGPQLDWSKWEIEVNAFGGGNNELQLYTDRSENVRIENGCLVLEARKERADIQGTVRDYSSGRVRSKRRGDWKYGRFEMRARLPAGQGVWPAFWLMPTDNKYGTWASSGEIDIMEFKGQEPNNVWGTLHYGAAWPNNKHSGSQYKLPTGNLTDDFHTYGLEWSEGKIQWLLDGKVWQTQTKWESSGGKYPAPFDQEFHIILNLAIGGGFVGAPNDKTPFPATYLIDWVKVSQKSP
jgi:beta-glucanase (GH16 family)